MNTLQTDAPWYRRISQVAIATALFVLLFFVYGYFFGQQNVEASLEVGTAPAILAGITLLAAGVMQLSLPKRAQEVLPILTQGLLIATVAALIHTTGGLYSPFAALWVPAVLFVGAFGITGLLMAAVLPLGYSLWLAIGDMLALPTGVAALLIGGVPLGLSYLIFSRHSSSPASSNPYGELTSQLNRISDKAEIVINAITNGVIALDKDGIIQLINPAAQHLIGWESSDALKLDYKSVLKLEDEASNELAPAADPIRQVLSTNEEVRTEELRLVTRSGKKMDISLVASPVGQPGSGTIIVFADITKEKAEERDQAEFISTASHEMRTPVASIEGYLGLALNPATAQIDDKARTYITKAHEVAQHLGRLFQDLLDITKAEDGRLSNTPRAVEVVSFIQDVVEGMRPQAEAKGLILLYKPVPEVADNDKTSRRLNPVFYANVDNDHLREIVSNLVENAIKYTKQGTIAVDIGGDEKQIEISVQDTGIGIPTEDLSHLFQKFYRVDNSDTREIGGTGLGLYLSRRLAEAMEGRIWAESQQGQGSTFFLSIPRISHQEAMQLIETLGEDTPAQTIGPVVGGPVFSPQEPSPSMPAAPAVAPGFSSPASSPETPVATPSQAAQGAFTANSPSDGVFVNPPADVIATQLSAAPKVIQPTSPQPPTAPSGEPSLAMIEQDPQRYLRRPDDTGNQEQA